jgi:hypothetical protein
MNDDLELCERENSNLRQHLLWAATRLSPAERIELRDRIAGPIANGGVVGDLAADDRAIEFERESAIEALTDHVQDLINKPLIITQEYLDAWITNADLLSNRLRGFLQPAKELTFHELHNPPEPVARAAVATKEDA